MTQDSKTALELQAQCKQLHAAVNRTEEQTRVFDSIDIGKSLRSELIYADVSKMVSAGEELRVFCKGKLSIKQDMEEEIRKIDAEIRTKSSGFDRENQAKLDNLNDTIRNNRAKHDRWERAQTITRIASWILSIGWVVFVFAKFAADHPKILQDLGGLILLGPIVLCFVIGAIVRGFMDDITAPAAVAIVDAKKEIESIHKERKELIASIEKKKEDYLEILKRV